MSSVNWSRHVRHGSAPLIACDLALARQWSGKVKTGGRVVHHWGQFTARIPERFRPQGDAGHQFIEVSSQKEAKALVAALLRAIRESFPDAQIEESSATHVRIDGVGEMHIRVLPAQLSIRAEAALSALEYPASVVMVSVEGGAVVAWKAEGDKSTRIGVTEGGHVLMLRSWNANQQQQTLLEQLCAGGEGNRESGTLDCPSGSLVILPASLDARPLLSSEDHSQFCAKGALLSTEARTYRIQEGDHLPDGGWGATWCRLIPA